ncbi:MAG: archaemetzincin [Planctomycetota bacterium]|nr:archaemetzincin [Planctomycetota bacterium]
MIVLRLFLAAALAAAFVTSVDSCEDDQSDPDTTGPEKTAPGEDEQETGDPQMDERTKRMYEFALNDDTDFEVMPKPQPGDWLYSHAEQHQTFDDYVGTSPRRPADNRRKITIIPIGDFPGREEKLLEPIREYCSIVFSCETVLLPKEKIPPDAPGRPASWDASQTQYRTGYLLTRFLRPRVPRDAICLLGITMADLYPDDGWNYVFGEASLRDRVGVFSFVRFFPEFYGQEPSEENLQVALMRCLKTMAHETGHMFSLPHCVKYKCLMNGANSQSEQDSGPIHACPYCLKKLQWNTGFDLLARYEKLAQFYDEHGYKEEAEWVTNRLKKIRASAE